MVPYHPLPRERKFISEETSYRISYSLNVQEVLIALSICASTNPIIEKAMGKIEELRGCEAHSTYRILKLC